MDQPTPRRRNLTFNVPGHAHFLTFSCFRRLPLLTNELWREWLAEALMRSCTKHDFALWAYVFMPEHVHLLLKPRREKYDLNSFEHDFKMGPAKKVIEALKRSGSTLLDQIRVVKPGGYKFRFWQRGTGFDLNVWTMKKAVEKAEYCHRNPVLRRLVAAPEQWRWSSYRWLELGRRENEPVNIVAWDDDCISEVGQNDGFKRPKPSAPKKRPPEERVRHFSGRSTLLLSSLPPARRSIGK